VASPAARSSAVEISAPAPPLLAIRPLAPAWSPRLTPNAPRGTAAIQEAVAFCNGPAIEVDRRRVCAALEQLRAWLATRIAAETIDFRAASAARSRRTALARVAQALARAPRHQRSRLAPLAAAARAVATAPMAEGAERILDMLVESQLPDEAWLRSLATFGELNARPRDTSGHASTSGAVLAIVLLEPV